VRAYMRRACGLERTAPAVVILARGQVLAGMVRGRQHIRAIVPARCRRKQPIGFLAHGLGHAAGLAVGPDDAPVLEVHPIPLERDDFAATAGELELQPDRERDDVALQSLGLQMLKMTEQLAHVLVANEVGGLAVGEHRDMPARIGAVGPVAPHLGQIEHAAHDAERAVRVGRLVRHLLHHPGHVRALHVLNLHPADHRDDVAVDDALIAFLGAGLVAQLGVVLHELRAKLLDRGRFARLRLVCGRVAAPAHLGQPFLSQRAGLFDGQFPVLTQGGLAALAGVRPVLEHEHLAARWGNLAQEAGHQGIPEFDSLRLGLCRIDCGLGELDLCHDDSSERPDSQEPHRGHQQGSWVRFRKEPAYVELA